MAESGATARPSVLFTRDFGHSVWAPVFFAYTVPATLVMLPIASLLRITDDTVLFLVTFIPGYVVAAVGASLTERWLARVHGLRIAFEGITVGRKLHVPWRELTRAEVRDGRLVAFARPGTALGLGDAVRGRWNQALGGYVLAELWRYRGYAYGLEEALREFAPDGAGPP